MRAMKGARAERSDLCAGPERAHPRRTDVVSEDGLSDETTRGRPREDRGRDELLVDHVLRVKHELA
jgi:hypothetical protein